MDEVDQLWQELRQKDAQILMLQKKLSHFRSWVSGIHAKVQQMNPQAIKNSRRLYVGGIPEDTTEVGPGMGLACGGVAAPPLSTATPADRLLLYASEQEELKQFLGGLMMRTGALTAPGNAVISSKITQVSKCWWARGGGS